MGYSPTNTNIVEDSDPW